MAKNLSDILNEAIKVYYNIILGSSHKSGSDMYLLLIHDASIKTQFITVVQFIVSFIVNFIIQGQTGSLTNQMSIVYLSLLGLVFIDNQWFVFKLKRSEKDTDHLLRIQTQHVIIQLWSLVVQTMRTRSSSHLAIDVCVANAIALQGLDIFVGRYIKLGLLALRISHLTYWIQMSPGSSDLFSGKAEDVEPQWVGVNLVINVFILLFLFFNQSFLKEKLLEQNERITFQFNLSHDLRNYVTSINVEDMTPEEYEKQTEQIAYSLNKMQHFELLFINKYNYKQINIRNRDSLVLIADRCAALFLQKDNKIKFSVKEQRPSISVDEKLLTQLFDFVLLKMHEVGFVNIVVNIEIRNESEMQYTLDLKFKYQQQLRNKDVSILLDSNILKKLMQYVAKDSMFKSQFDLTKSELCMEFLFASKDSSSGSAGDLVNKQEIVVKGDEPVDPKPSKTKNTPKSTKVIKNEDANGDPAVTSPRLNPNKKDPHTLQESENDEEKLVINTMNDIDINFERSKSEKNPEQYQEAMTETKSKKKKGKKKDEEDEELSALGNPAVHVHKSGIQINVDDEQCVLRMNARMFKKQGITINQCKNRTEFLGLLETISGSLEQQSKNLKILMDHVLDRDFGQLVIAAGQELNSKKKLGLMMQFVLVSSSESEDTTAKYIDVGVNNVFPKPLTLNNVREFVAQSSFIQPCEPLSKSGGTASMFKVTQIDEAVDQWSRINTNQWLGKDIDRAYEEVIFQDKVKEIQQSQTGSNKKNYPKDFGLLDYTMDQQGKVTLNCGQKVKNLMLIKNQRSGVQRLRFLDIKLGAYTAVGGWQGKGHLGAFLQQTFVDNFTNTFAEGQRLEGFDCPPWSLQSRNFVRKDLQRMKGQEVMKLMVDFKDLNRAKTQHWQGKHILFTQSKKLFDIVTKAKSMKVPQKWIGSSIGFLFEIEDFGYDIAKYDPTVVLFDWGRCILVNEEEYNTQAHVDKIDRQEFWLQYCEALKRLMQETLFLYQHKQCMEFDMIEIVLILRDELGSVFIKRESIEEMLEQEVHEGIGRAPDQASTSCTPTLDIPIHFKITKVDAPGIVYRLNVKQAEYVPVFLDLTGLQQCMIRVNWRKDSEIIYSEDSAYSSERIKPTWNEFFDFEMNFASNTKEFLKVNQFQHPEMDEKKAKEQFEKPNQEKYNADF